MTSVPRPDIVCQSIEPPSSPWISVRTIWVPSPDADLALGEADAVVPHETVSALLRAVRA